MDRVNAAARRPANAPTGLVRQSSAEPALPLSLLFLQEIISERDRNPAGNLGADDAVKQRTAGSGSPNRRKSLQIGKSQRRRMRVACNEPIKRNVA